MQKTKEPIQETVELQSTLSQQKTDPTGGSGLPVPPQTTETEQHKTQRTQIQDTLTEEETALLLDKNKPQPDFEILEDKQVAKLGKSKRKAYKKQKAAYDAKVQEWRGPEERRKGKVRQQIQVRQMGDTWPTLEATPDMMDKALQQNLVDSTELAQLAQLEHDAWAYYDATNMQADDGLQRYMETTRAANIMNRYLRSLPDGVDPASQRSGDMYGQFAIKGVKGLKQKKLSHDMVSRRGVGTDALAHMLGAGNLTQEQAKTELLHRMQGGGECVLTEKGFCSTAIMPNAGYDGDMELIILCRKGTSAVDYSCGISRETEKELLIAPGTKFRVVKAFFNEDGPEDQRTLTRGAAGGWKIYLETIPQGGDTGVPA